MTQPQPQPRTPRYRIRQYDPNTTHVDGSPVYQGHDFETTRYYDLIRHARAIERTTASLNCHVIGLTPQPIEINELYSAIDYLRQEHIPLTKAAVMDYLTR